MTGIEIAGAALAAAGAVYGGFKQNQMLKFNAKLAEREGQYAQVKSRLDVADRKRDVMRQLGANRAEFGASGVSLLSGSFQDVQLESLTEAERDYAAIRFGGTTYANRAKAQASSYRDQGKASLIGSGFEAGSTLLTAYGKA